MWTIPEVFTKIPQVNINDYQWYVISFKTFKKLKLIQAVISSYDSDNILWIPVHDELKRIQSQRNQVITIDKPNYPNYGFIGIHSDVTDINILRTEINYTFFAEILKGHVFPDEMKRVFEEAYKIISKTKEPNFKVGSTVFLASGVFYGTKAKILSVKGLKVYLEVLLGQNTIKICTNVMDIIKCNED